MLPRRLSITCILSPWIPTRRSISTPANSRAHRGRRETASRRSTAATARSCFFTKDQQRHVPGEDPARSCSRAPDGSRGLYSGLPRRRAPFQEGRLLPLQSEHHPWNAADARDRLLTPMHRSRVHSVCGSVCGRLGEQCFRVPGCSRTRSEWNSRRRSSPRSTTRLHAFRTCGTPHVENHRVAQT
jgi:hypothetical protein